MTKRHGVALGTVLICLLALSVVLFTAVTASVSHLRMVNAAENQDHARNLAESAIATAISQIAETGEEPAEIEVSIEGIDGEGTLSFSSFPDFKGYSTFNLDGSEAVSGAGGRVVPAHTVHLVGKGQVGSARAYVECLYYRPPFPDGLIASGPIKASALKLYAIRRDAAYTGGDPELIAGEDSLPGNLFSNSSQGWTPAEPAAQISNHSDISGSLGAVGTVSLDASSVVAGELLPNSQFRPIPSMDIEARIAVLRPNAIPVFSGPGLSLDADWFAIAEGGLNVSGDLDLNGSALLVTGNLTVTGAVLGTGVVLVTGDATISDGGSSVTAGEQTAIACKGDFTLRAPTPEENFFKGLVYCEGDFLAGDITVVGATVVNAERNPSKQGRAELENVSFVHNPGAVNVSLSAPRGYRGYYRSDERNHQAAIAWIRVPAATGNGFDYHLRYALTLDSDSSNDAPRIWPTENASEFRGAGTILITSVQLHEEMTLEEIQNHPDTQRFAREIGQKLNELDNGKVNWTDYLGNIQSNRNRDESMPLARALHSDLHAENPIYNITFNLNNLLGEVMGNSRLLLYRPLPQ